MPPSINRTIVDSVFSRADTKPDHSMFTFLYGTPGRIDQLTAGVLAERVTATAGYLSRICAPGERALLIYPPGLDYLIGFLAAVSAGVIAVPLYPPQRRQAAVVEAVATDCQASLVLCSDAALPKQQLFHRGDLCSGLLWVATDTECPQRPDGEEPPLPTLVEDDVAYLQYTSGSTADPKGVIIDHGTIMKHCRDLAESWDVTADSRIVTWLPHFHDFGQLVAHLLPLFVGCPSIRMAPGTFIQQPIRWLDALSRYRGTHTGAPNFAYDLCVDKTTEAERSGLDLSALRVAVNGAEPVRLSTIHRFETTLAAHGLRPGVICPGFGLAEATLKVTSRGPGQPLSVRSPELRPYGDSPTAAWSPEAAVGCGATTAETIVEIVDTATLAPVEPGAVGEIWVHGPGVARGYWERPAETEATFGGRLLSHPGRRFLRTGDLGFSSHDQLYICGRIKDLIIIDGTNYYPQDVESAVEDAHPSIRRGHCAAFAVDERGTDRLVIVIERSRHAVSEVDALVCAVRATVADRHGLSVDDIVLVGIGGTPRTSSGKVQRGRCRARYLADELPVEHHWRSTARTPSSLDAAAACGRLRGWAAELTDTGMETIDVSLPLAAAGLTSLHLVQLHGLLEDWTGMTIPEECVWEASSLDDLAERIVRIGPPTETLALDRAS